MATDARAILATARTANPVSGMNNDSSDSRDLDAARLVTVAERPTEAGAAILVAVLADAGIRAVATGGFTAGFRAEAPGWVHVKTLDSDASRACQIIAELRVEPPDNADQEPDDD